MAKDWDGVPDIEEQTLLDEPIKIRWGSEDRTRLRRAATAAVEDGWTKVAIARPIYSRQKTQIVIKTEEELEAFRKQMKNKSMKPHVSRRIKNEIKSHVENDGSSDTSKNRTAEDISDDICRRVRNSDLDRIMEQEVKPHAQEWVQRVWDTDTVNLDIVSFFWNPQLTDSAGTAYKHGTVPRTMTSGPYAIGLAPDYYYEHGLSELLETVRHELIHIWQYMQPRTKSGHGPSFKQWVTDMNTHRHCQHWNRVGYKEIIEGK